MVDLRKGTEFVGSITGTTSGRNYSRGTTNIKMRARDKRTFDMKVFSRG